MRSVTRSDTSRMGTAVALLLAAALVIAGCSSPASTSSTTSVGESAARGSAGSASNLAAGPTPSAAPADAAKGAADALPSQGSATTPVPKLVIVSKTLRLEIEDANAALTRIREFAKRDGGDISDLQVATATDQPIYRDPIPVEGGASTGGPSAALRAYVTVRVPVARFQAFVDDVAKLGRVLFQSESAQDVTQQHVDLKARLGNLNAEQQRLRQMFAKARNVTEMLQVERELSRVQGEIEAMQGQIDYLERQAAMATVTIELAEPKAVVRPTGTDWGVAKAFTSSIQAFVSTLNGLIVILGPLLALLIFLVLPVFLIVRLILRIVRRPRTPKPAPVAAEPPAQAPEDAE